MPGIVETSLRPQEDMLTEISLEPEGGTRVGSAGQQDLVNHPDDTVRRRRVAGGDARDVAFCAACLPGPCASFDGGIGVLQ